MLPSSGKKIPAYTKDGVAVPIDKVEIYMRDGVKNVKDELRELQILKQSNRKLFDADPNNAIKLDELKKMNKNYDRSSAMNDTLNSIGLTNTPQNNTKIVENLLNTGKKVTSENKIWVESIVEGPKGKLLLQSTWNIDVDGYIYLSTVKTMPISH